MNKFKVGDLIRGKENDYNITNENMYLGKVIKKYSNEMLVKILKHKDINEIGEYWVDNTSKDFELVDNTIETLQNDIAKLENKLKKKKKQLEELQRKPILDDVEKEYLKAVIRPFKKEIVSISKEETFGEEFISINHEVLGDNISFPTFKKGTMYIGMELEKEYTLKELGLD